MKSFSPLGSLLLLVGVATCSSSSAVRSLRAGRGCEGLMNEQLVHGGWNLADKYTADGLPLASCVCKRLEATSAWGGVNEKSYDLYIQTHQNGRMFTAQQQRYVDSVVKSCRSPPPKVDKDGLPSESPLSRENKGLPDDSDVPESKEVQVAPERPLPRAKANPRPPQGGPAYKKLWDAADGK